MRYGLCIFVFVITQHLKIHCSGQHVCSDDQEFQSYIHVINDTSVRISSLPTPNSFNVAVIDKVEFWHMNYLACAKNESDGIVKIKEVAVSNLRINHLLPFSQYGIKITYSEDTLTCTKETTFNTTESATLTDEERPVISHRYTAKEAFVSIEWQCQNQRGPITRNISIICNSQSCNEDNIEYTKNETISRTDLSFRINNQTEYILRLNYQRGDDTQSEEYPIFINLQEPHKVRNLVAYDVNNTSVSLKWLPPDPPTGDIEFYEIRYYQNINDSKIVKIDGLSNCKIWTEYICTTINGRKFLNETCNFEVRAKNRDVDKFGHYESFSITPDRDRVPSKPLNINYTLKDKQNLIVKWEHPNVPNGQILHFRISINREIHVIYNVSKERQNYVYEIDVSSYNLAEKTILVEITAANEIGSSKKGVNYIKQAHFLTLPRIENITDSKFDIKIPPVYNADGDISSLIVFLKDIESDVEDGVRHPTERAWVRKVGVIEEYSWIVGEFDLRTTDTVTVGDNSTSVSIFDNSWTFYNKILERDHGYYVALLLADKYIINNTTFTLYAYYPHRYVKTSAIVNGSTYSKVPKPHEVRNVVAYTVTDTSISLKWLPPDPPTGDIEFYEIRYYHNSNDTKEVKVLGSSICEIWREYICATINDINFINESYNFEIRAKNRGADEFGHYVFLNLTFGEGRVPSVPLNIKYTINEEQIIIIEWQHPDVPNGKIHQFYIDINGYMFFIYKVTIERLNYIYEIDAGNYNLTQEKLIVEVTAANEIGNSSIGVNFLSRPIFTLYPTIENVTDSKFDLRFAPFFDLEGNSSFYVVMADTEAPIVRLTKSNKLERMWYEKIDMPEEHSWFAGEYDARTINTVTIGDNSRSVSKYDSNWIFINRILDSNVCYNITFLVVNRYPGTLNYTYSAISLYVRTLIVTKSNDRSDFCYLWSLTLVPVLMSIIYTILLAIRRRRSNNRKHLKSKTLSNIYTSPIKSQISDLSEIYDGIVLDDPDFKKLIKLEELDAYIKSSIENNDLTRQYQLLPQGPIQFYDDGSLLPNRAKNRYPHLIAYDTTRVKLDVIAGDAFSDYINANYIDGYNAPKAYIATQTPTENTYGDFWRMIWQENVKYIIVAADLNKEEKEKDTGIYWPNINNHMDFSGIRVVYKNIEVMANYKIRHFALYNGHQERTVQQLHFISMPDYSRVPLYIHSLASFIKRILSITEEKSPIVVHCSDGISYTGIIILSDICLRKAIAECQINVVAELYKLRKQRINMVSNLEHYKVVHFVLLRILQCLKIPTETGIICDNTMESTIESILTTKLSQQMKYLEESFWQNEAMRKIDLLYDSIRSDKTPNSQEPAHSQLYRYSTIGDAKLFINTAIVDSFSTPSKFIVTSKPTSATLGVFWQFIFDKRIDTILCLDKLSLIADFEKTFKPLPKLEVICINHRTEEYFEVYTLHINESSNKKNNMKVNIIHIRNWPLEAIHPDHPDHLIMTYEELNRLGTSGRPILITCHDGVRAGGLFVAMCFLIEKIRNEHVCDVCLAVKSVRHSRKEYVRGMEQFAFLYLCALEYVRKFNMYANFDHQFNDD